MPTKTERGNRVFPVSDHSSDVIAALSTALRGQHVEVFLHTKVKRLLLERGMKKSVLPVLSWLIIQKCMRTQ